ncbi:MAG TPA: rhomboid family intramembrane serine protease [Bacteroidales bacterium]|jgi:membrane associated rhomboid family serine protease|nr:rhomboid family intramembrane serine protease [Bacteroidota bacterium]HJN05444.1 rhomboid family intramembrane serine protease [Bacteroidales bacterium]
MSKEKRKFIYSLLIPIGLLFIMWMVKIIEYSFNISFVNFGNYPLDIKGVKGIFLMPFIHGDWDHLIANSVPFLILSSALFYFYSSISVRVLVGIWFLSGIWVWFGGRPSWHIGASGLIYGLSSFLFVSGLIRKDTRLAALALIVTFLYGSLIWGAFPDFFPKEKNISWEGHLGGAIAGLVLALYYRNSGPKRKQYSWELEEETDEENDDKAYWKIKQ